MIFKFKELSLVDKPVIDNYFLNAGIKISEYTFTNLFVWKNYRKISFCEYKNGLIILAETNEGKFFMPPVGFDNKAEIIKELFDSRITNQLRRTDEDTIAGIAGSGYGIVEDPDNYDYVYNADDLAQLAGRKYSNKRNFIVNFFSEYEFVYDHYSEKYKEDCIVLCKKWLTHHDDQDKTLIYEYEAIVELLNNFDKLNVTGNVIVVEGKVEAFAFGEKLNNTTFVMHFEKGNIDLKGIYQSINKLFVEKEVAGKYQFVNREQDLGIAGIRKAKESYFPAEMTKKYIVKKNI